jgi:hypothetical protein
LTPLLGAEGSWGRPGFASRELHEVGGLGKAQFVADHGHRQQRVRQQALGLEDQAVGDHGLGSAVADLERSARQAPILFY